MGRHADDRNTPRLFHLSSETRALPIGAHPEDVDTLPIGTLCSWDDDLRELTAEGYTGAFVVVGSFYPDEQWSAVEWLIECGDVVQAVGA
jgi:hypothetical protein